MTKTTKSPTASLRILLLQASILTSFGTAAFAQGSESPIATTAVDPAQSAASPSSPATGDVNDIVVTALKRGTRIQETPISISAVTSETLANSGVQSIANLGSTVPSLNVIDSGPSNRRVVIRGIQAAGEPTVGVYYDETPVTGVVGASNDAGGSTPELRLFDVERVEVLRGPQGTLYGSGSMGGTLRIIYKKPTMKSEGAADATLSTTDSGGLNYELNGVINTPIVTDKVALRAVGYYRHANGYIDNTYLNIKNINDEKNYGGRLLLRLTPVERLTIDLSAFYNKSNTDTPSWTTETGKYKTDNRVRLPVRDEIQLYGGTATYDLGGVTATGVVSYMDRKLSSTSDTSRFIQNLGTAATYATRCANGACVNPTNVQVGSPGVPAGGITTLAQYLNYVGVQSTSNLFPQQDLNALTAELRLNSSDGGPLNWTIGAFYSRRKTNVENPQVNANPATGVMYQPLQIDTIRIIDDTLKQYAGFGDISWDVNEKLNLTGGIRFFKYTKDIVGQTPIPSILVGARVTPPTAINSSETGHVIKANASYKFTRDIMVYAEAAQGFRPGGANQVLGLDAALTPYESDKLWNYEAGIKTSFFDRKLIINFDGFWIDWTNMQITGRTPNGAFSFITNAGKARVKGLELETTVRPIEGFSIQGSASYIDAKLTQNQASSQVQAPGLKGDRIPFVPKFTVGVGAQYEMPVSDLLQALYRVDLQHSSGYLSDFRPRSTAAPFTRSIEAYDLVNVRVGVETKETGWGAYLFVTNLFNDTAITRASSSAIGVGLTSVTSARPRTIGLNVRTVF